MLFSTHVFFTGGGSKLASLTLTHQRDGRDHFITLSPSGSHSRKQSIDWLKGLRKVIIIIIN